jgi:hypothetical protein
MDSKFDDLVKGLEQQMLEELRRSVVAELNERRGQTAIQVGIFTRKCPARTKCAPWRRSSGSCAGRKAMRDLQQYWREVRTLAASLPASVWLVSLDDPKRGLCGGRMVEAAPETAAKLLHANSHRRATDEEIQAHTLEAEQEERAAFRERLRIKGVAVVPVSKQK